MSNLSTIFPIAVTAPRIDFDSLWTLIILFSGLSITYFVLVFLLKRRLTRKENKAIVLKKDIAPLLSTLLFKSNDGTRKESEDVMYAKVHVKELLKNPDRRKKISEILIDIRADLPGETRKRILKMYLEFELHEDAINSLNSWRWEEVCRGINELTQMQVTDAYIYIRKFINDKRSIVRKQAQLAMVALKPEGIVYFLDHARYAISEWQQLKILETLQQLPDFKPPQFRLWLTSKNQHVVLFAIRLIRSFEQDDAMESILKLVKHRDDAIKVEAINCIRDFKYRAAIPLFKKIFQNCISVVKLALLNAIGEMGDKRDIHFLRHVEQHAVDHIVKSKAIGTINALAPESILPSDKINESLAADLGIMEVGNIQDLEEPKDPVQHDLDHERFQDALKAPDFNKHTEGLQDESLCFDLFLEEDLKEILVYTDDPLEDSAHSPTDRVVDKWETLELQDQPKTEILPDDAYEDGADVVLPEFKLELKPHEPDANKQRKKDIGEETQQPGIAKDSTSSDFEKIFRYMNEDMKLAIIADILQLGDERELKFLHKLKNDKSARVRRNAAHTYQMLTGQQPQKAHVVQADRTTDDERTGYAELAFEIDLETIRPNRMVDELSSFTNHVQAHLERKTDE